MLFSSLCAYTSSFFDMTLQAQAVQDLAEKIGETLGQAEKLGRPCFVHHVAVHQLTLPFCTDCLMLSPSTCIKGGVGENEN